MMSPVGMNEQTKPSGSPFDRRLELNKEVGDDYQGNHHRESDRIQAAYFIRSEAVAKFSSFRQLRFSTIRNFSAVMRVTAARDGRHQGFATGGERHACDPLPFASSA